MPLRSSKTNKHRYPPWFTKNIVDKITLKNSLLETRTSNPQNYNYQIKLLSHSIYKCIRQSYNAYLQSSVETSLRSNPKSFWSVVDRCKKSPFTLASELNHALKQVIVKKHGCLKGRSTLSNLIVFSQATNEALQKGLKVDACLLLLKILFSQIHAPDILHRISLRLPKLNSRQNELCWLLLQHYEF